MSDKEKAALPRPGNARLGPKTAGERPGQSQPGGRAEWERLRAPVGQVSSVCCADCTVGALEGPLGSRRGQDLATGQPHPGSAPSWGGVATRHWRNAAPQFPRRPGGGRTGSRHPPSCPPGPTRTPAPPGRWPHQDPVQRGCALKLGVLTTGL